MTTDGTQRVSTAILPNEAFLDIALTTGEVLFE